MLIIKTANWRDAPGRIVTAYGKDPERHQTLRFYTYSEGLAETTAPVGKAGAA
jgi:hypothetical protein